MRSSERVAWWHLRGAKEHKPGDFAEGDIVRYTGKFLRNTGQAAGAPLNGKVVEVNSSGFMSGWPVVSWSDGSGPVPVNPVNVEFDPRNRRRAGSEGATPSRVASLYLGHTRMAGRDFPAEGEDLLLDLLALLRAQHWLYWNLHWITQGPAFYGNHLLFSRLYDDQLETDVDDMAEKIVGYCGSEALDPSDSMMRSSVWLEEWTAESDDIFVQSLQSETDLQAFADICYNSIKDLGAMTLGLDDFIMALASRHDVNQYLLGQVVGTPRVASQKVRAAAENVAPSAEGQFFDNPEKREVREFAETNALTNIPEVAEDAAPELDESVSEAVDQAEEAPPTPEEVAEEPGGEQLSTLNRFVVQSEDPEVTGVPDGHGEVPKHPAPKESSVSRQRPGW